MRRNRIKVKLAENSRAIRSASKTCERKRCENKIIKTLLYESWNSELFLICLIEFVCFSQVTTRSKTIDQKAERTCWKRWDFRFNSWIMRDIESGIPILTSTERSHITMSEASKCYVICRSLCALNLTIVKTIGCTSTRLFFRERAQKRTKILQQTKKWLWKFQN